MDDLIKAKLGQLAASAQLTKVKADQGKHWEGELKQELNRISNLAREIVQSL
jgi:hypothetical protein